MRKNNIRNLIQSEQWSGYGFTFPALLVLVLLVTYPLLYGTYISFFDTNLVNRWNFVGIENYIRIFSNSEFIRSIGLTLLYSILVIMGHFVVGIILGLILNMKLRGILFFRAILILPWLIPEVVVALIWKWLFNPVSGLFNHYLMLFNITSEPISWLGNESTAFIAIVLVSIWKGFPLIMMMVLAGLQSISQEQYEAAKIDGANLFQSFRYITIPGLMPVLLVSLILDTVWWFKHFTMIWILTQGGPGSATNIVSIDVFKQAFEFFNFGRASAMAVIIFFVCFFIGLTYRRILGNDDN